MGLLMYFSERNRHLIEVKLDIQNVCLIRLLQQWQFVKEQATKDNYQQSLNAALETSKMVSNYIQKRMYARQKLPQFGCYHWIRFNRVIAELDNNLNGINVLYENIAKMWGAFGKYIAIENAIQSMSINKSSTSIDSDKKESQKYHNEYIRYFPLVQNHILQEIEHISNALYEIVLCIGTRKEKEYLMVVYKNAFPDAPLFTNMK